MLAGKTFSGFLAGGDSERGSVGGVPPKFLRAAACRTMREHNHQAYIRARRLVLEQ